MEGQRRAAAIRVLINPFPLCLSYSGVPVNSEHFDVLKGGADRWNKWRLANTVRPDLHGADLSGTDLCGADLSHSDLVGALLREVNADRINLQGASLISLTFSARISTTPISAAPILCMRVW